MDKGKLSILENFPNPIWVCDDNAKCYYFNRGWYEFTGRTYEQEKGDGWADSVHKDDISACLDIFLKAFAEKKPFSMEYRLLHKSGKYRYLLDCGSPVFEENGEFCGFIGSCYDIDDAKNTDIYHAEIKSEYETILNTVSEPMGIIDVVDEKEFFYRKVNRSHELILGLKNESITGRSPAEIFGQEKSLKLIAGYKKCIDERKTVEYQEIINFGTGEIMWHVTSSPIFKNGKITQIVISRQDISKFINMENELIRREENIRLLLNSTAEAIYGIDLDGVCTFCNASCIKMLGYRYENELIGKKMHDLIHYKDISGKPIDADECKILKTVKSSEKTHSDSEVFWRADGTSFAVEYYSYPQYREGTLCGVVVTFFDISERKKTEQEISYLSYHDALTGLFNRRYGENMLKITDTDENLPYSIIMADINGLKLANDTFGHATGDRLLQCAAETISRHCADGTAARWGGDEFIILLPKTKLSDAEEICRNIKSSFSQETVKAIRGSISIGCSAKISSGEDILRVMDQAEIKMYNAKTLEKEQHGSTAVEYILKSLFKQGRQEAHANNVSKYCRKIAEAMELSKTEVFKAELAGFYHDIGKITEFDSDNADPEHKKVKQHTEAGFRILSSSKNTADIASAVLAHHECYDGSGYPKGIAGEEIPLISRIIAVSDALDSMISGQKGTKFTKSKAILNIAAQADIAYDRKVCEAMIKAFK